MSTTNTGDPPMPVRKRPQSDDLRIRLKWLMLMRVILVTFLFGVTILVSLRGGPIEVVSSFTALYLLIGYAYLLTGLSAFFFNYIKRPVLFSYIQIVGDILFITGILQITGGVESPFVFLYFLSIISGSLLRYQQGSLVAVILSALSYMILFYLNPVGGSGFHLLRTLGDKEVQLYYRTFLNIFSFAIIAFLSNQLARRLKIAGEELKEKEDSMKDLEVLYESIIQSVTSGLVTTNLAGRITSVNPSAEKILGRPSREIRQTSLEQLFPYPEVRDFLATCAAEEKAEPLRFECTYTDPESGEMILGMTLSLLKDNSVERTGILSTFQDLTRIKALEEKMRQKEQLAMIGELAAAIAHEIRNPLASMSGSIQVLRSELDLTEENRRLMEIILKETDRLNNLIGNFLTYARPRPLECRPTHLRELVEETVTLLKRSRRIGETIAIGMEIDEDMAVSADPTAMRQVLWNITINAIEAMPHGGILRFTAEKADSGPSSHDDREARFVQFTISDTGEGIDPGIRKKLFFPFHTTKERGSGLGLAIVHQIIRQHGGWVDVVSTRGEGATFQFYLPAAVRSMVC